MIFKTEEEIILKLQSVIKAVPDHIQKGRDYNKELKALVNGDGFRELLTKIESIESDKKAIARKKYSRSIKDFFERLQNPISNVFSATGGTKRYDISNDTQHAEFIKTISNVKDGKSIEHWINENWMSLYHTDPAGLIFMEWNESKTYPTYKNIASIRDYKSRGQLVEYVVFEPKDKKSQTGPVKHWRIVDDLYDYTFEQRGNTFVFLEKFNNPFGEVPALICSNLLEPGTVYRLSPFDKIVEVAKEYLRDQSIKTLYKFLHGFPIHWRYVMQCNECNGVGKKGEVSCPNCNGLGYIMKNDVTDIVALPVPEKEDIKLAPEIAGYISPDLETWNQYTAELQLLDRIAFETHWGTYVEKGTNETATGRFIDVQPVMNKLNKYADVTEFVEWKITEWIANYIMPTKDKKERISSINYGRRYIIEPPDVILERYEKSREKGVNLTILDRIFNEYLTAKFKNDPDYLRISILKSEIEPYLHYTVKEVSDIFGIEEAKKKMMFRDWWEGLSYDDYTKGADKLKASFQQWSINQ